MKTVAACLYALLTLAQLRLFSGCPTSCTCNERQIHCTGCHEYVNHTEIPENVTSLTYESCFLSEISTNLMYTHLLSLSIRNSSLANISDGIFAGMEALKTLDLRYNVLRNVTRNAFSGLNSLQDLYLSYNRLTTLPNMFFSGLPSLVHVQLDGNAGFLFLFSSFDSAPNNLSHISCAWCSITEIEPVMFALRDVRQLRDLSLSGNPLTSLPPNSFLRNLQLETLRLDNCSIATVNESSFSGLSHLHKLNLSLNSMQNLPSDLFVDSKATLRILFLSHNLLTSCDKDLLDWSSVTELHLEENPWNCNCELEWIRSFNLGIDSTNATCAQPEALLGKNIQTYPIDCEDRNPSAVVLTIVIPIIIICLAVIGCFLYRVIQTAVTRKRHAREKSSVRYSAVYKETVEPTGSKQRSGVTLNYSSKQDSRI